MLPLQYFSTFSSSSYAIDCMCRLKYQAWYRSMGPKHRRGTWVWDLSGGDAGSGLVLHGRKGVWCQPTTWVSMESSTATGYPSININSLDTSNSFFLGEKHPYSGLVTLQSHTKWNDLGMFNKIQMKHVWYSCSSNPLAYNLKCTILSWS